MREPIHPGETVCEGLDALGMSAAEIARRIGVPVSRIAEMLNGRRSITGDTALRLGRFYRRCLIAITRLSGAGTRVGRVPGRNSPTMGSPGFGGRAD